MMLSKGEIISHAAYAVGYESVSQFTREYSRLFGLPPGRDIKTSKRERSQWRSQALISLATSN